VSFTTKTQRAQRRTFLAGLPGTLCGLCVVVVISSGCGTYSPLESHYNRGVEYYDQGRLPEAIREYRLALEDNPTHYRAQFNLAVCFHDQGKLDEAAVEYEAVLRHQPENARALVSLASVRVERGKDGEALALLERAAAADRDSGFPRSARGAYYERKGDFDRALEAYRESVKVEPGHGPGHGGIARILLGRGDLDGARLEFDRALAADGDDVSLLLGAAEVREKQQDAKGATLLLERALVHVRDRAALWLRLAALYEAQGRLEDAIAALWEARGVDPANAAVGPRLKTLYGRLADTEK